MWMIVQMVFVLTVVGTLCQKIKLDPFHQIPPCTSGLRTGTDSFIINGIIAENVTDFLANHWEERLYIEVLTKTSGSTTLCPITVTSTRCSNPDRTLPCYCDDVNPTTGHVHFVITYTAVVSLSEGIIRAQWGYNDSIMVYSDNQTLPGMYDVNKTAELKLDISGMTGNLTTPGLCSFSVTLNKSNQLTLCCLNTAKPCYPKISFRGDVISSNSCVSYPTSRLPPAGVTGNLVLSLSVCDQSDFVPEGRCTVTTRPEDEATTTTSSTNNSTFATGESSTTLEPTTEVNSKTDEATTLMPSNSSAAVTDTPGKEKNIALIVCLSVILPIVFICIGVGIWYYYKKKSKKSKSVSTNESTANENNPEHHKKDSQLSGHQNLGFDEGQTSPSNVIINEVNANRPGNVQQHENGSNKQFTGKTNDGSASKNMPAKSRDLPPLKGTPTYNNLQPSGQPRPTSVELTSSPAVKPYN